MQGLLRGMLGISIIAHLKTCLKKKLRRNSRLEGLMLVSEEDANHEDYAYCFGLILTLNPKTPNIQG